MAKWTTPLCSRQQEQKADKPLFRQGLLLPVQSLQCQAGLLLESSPASAHRTALLEPAGEDAAELALEPLPL